MVQWRPVQPSVVDAREAGLSPPPYTHRLRAFCCRPFVSLSLLALSIRPALLSSVSVSVAQFICLQGQRPLDAFILRSLVQFLLCSVHLSLVAVFFPKKIQNSVVRLHYITPFSPLFAAQRRMLSRAPITATILHILTLLQNTVNIKHKDSSQRETLQPLTLGMSDCCQAYRRPSSAHLLITESLSVLTIFMQ